MTSAAKVPRSEWDRAPWNRWSFQHIADILPTAEISRGDGPVRELPRNEQDLDDLEISVMSVPDLPGRQRVKRIGMVATRIRLLEVYASRSAYDAHLRAPHFLKYKAATEKMVRSLRLIEADPILLCAKSAGFAGGPVTCIEGVDRK